MRLGDILRGVAKEQNLSLLELEMQTLTPSAVLATARGVDEDSEAALFLQLPFSQYVEWLLSKQFSNSCGATSGWLDEVTSRQSDRKKGTLRTVKSGQFVSDVIFAMISNNKRWYCRCTLKVHSFFIECIGRKAVIYQSYFGHYAMARSIEEGVERNRIELQPLLEAAVHHDKEDDKLSDWQQCTKLRKQLFLGQGPFHDLATVQCRLNTNPAPVDEIKKNILTALKQHRAAWKQMLGTSKTVQQLLDEGR
ncbi:MAG: hypothetical protein JXB05_33100 [Myxococcaceae bacterium]|nr:hypothetical protein [Myxococcaceae bacterium]